jgi:D-serine deaminase-like pyridoxal phosphate-dependent protein
VVDHPDNASALSDAATAAGKPLQVVIDIDPGLRPHRRHLAEAAVALWRVITDAPGLAYAGVQFYCGAHQHIASLEERPCGDEERAEYLRTVLAALTEAGGKPGLVTGGGTGTHRIDAALGVHGAAGRLVRVHGPPVPRLRVRPRRPVRDGAAGRGRVVSANTPGLVTIDAGLKAFATKAGAPVVLAGAPQGTQYRFMETSTGR